MPLRRRFFFPLLLDRELFDRWEWRLKGRDERELRESREPRELREPLEACLGVLRRDER